METSSNSIQESNPNNVKTVSLKGDLESDSEPSSLDRDHPLLPQATPSNHVVDNQEQGQDEEAEDDDDDDWLMSDEDIQGDPSLTCANQHQLKNLSIAHHHEPASSFHKVKSMADRDWERVEAQFKDAGYREGITAGKLSTLQSGFDSGFNKVGAPLGSRLGRLRGEAQAIKFFLESHSKDPSIKNRSQSPARKNMRKDASRSKLNKPNRPVINDIKMEQGKNELVEENENENSRAALELEIEGSNDLEAIKNAKKDFVISSSLSINTSSTSEVVPVSKPDPTTSSSAIEEQSPLKNLLALISELNKITLDDLAPPDYEAMKHEKEHLEGRANEIGSKADDDDDAEGEDDGLVRETEEERLRREGILTRFEERLEEIRRKVFTK